MPEVSVLMAVYNGGKFLHEAVRSVLTQTYNDFEFLIIDDASTDGSFEYLTSVAASDSRLRLFRADKQMGLVSALNLLLSEAVGEFVARMDADDICHPSRFREQVARFEKEPCLVLLGTRFEYIDRSGRKLSEGNPRLENEELQIELIVSGNPFCHPSVMMRTAPVKALGGYRQSINRYAQDYDLFLRLAKVGQVANLAQSLLGYRIHPGQITVNKMRPQLESALLYRALAQQRRTAGGEQLDAAIAQIKGQSRQLRGLLAAGYVFWADMMNKMGEPEKARALRWLAVRADPFGVAVKGLLKLRARYLLSRWSL